MVESPGLRFRELGAEGLTPFLCECGDARCTRMIKLTLDEYEAVRERADHFVIVPGHQILEAERVIQENQRYDVVEKVDIGRRVAEARDTRGTLPFQARAPHTQARADERAGREERGALPRGQRAHQGGE